MGLIFEWDEIKARLNFEKHGVTFTEAATVFDDPLSATIHDPQHSELEDRFVTIGWSHSSRTIVVVHADREERIRIVSAREATSGERKSYEEGNETARGR